MGVTAGIGDRDFAADAGDTHGACNIRLFCASHIRKQPRKVSLSRQRDAACNSNHRTTVLATSAGIPSVSRTRTRTATNSWSRAANGLATCDPDLTQVKTIDAEGGFHRLLDGEGNEVNLRSSPRGSAYHARRCLAKIETSWQAFGSIRRGSRHWCMDEFRFAISACTHSQCLVARQCPDAPPQQQLR